MIGVITQFDFISAFSRSRFCNSLKLKDFVLLFF